MTNSSSTQLQHDKDQVFKDQMEKIVDSYDSYMKRATFGREHILRQTTVELAGVKAGDTVLEVGCGTGTLTLAAKQAAGSSGKVIGIDIIPGMIEASQRKADQANAEVNFTLGGINSIPFPDGYFDVVLCSFMIFHMSDETRRKGIFEVQRVLKPDGRWLILDLALPAQPFQRVIAQKLLGFSAEENLRSLLPLMEAAGFSNLEYGPAEFPRHGAFRHRLLAWKCPEELSSSQNTYEDTPFSFGIATRALPAPAQKDEADQHEGLRPYPVQFAADVGAADIQPDQALLIFSKQLVG